MHHPFYLPFPTNIYLFKITNKNRKTLSKICLELRTKAPDQMFGTNFLQMCSFSILSTLWIYYFHCYRMSLLLLYLRFHMDSLHHHHDSPQFHISIRILRIPTLIPHNCIPTPFLTFPPLFSVFPLFHFPISLLGFYR